MRAPVQKWPISISGKQNKTTSAGINDCQPASVSKRFVLTIYLKEEFQDKYKFLPKERKKILTKWYKNDENRIRNMEVVWKL